MQRTCTAQIFPDFAEVLLEKRVVWICGTPVGVLSLQMVQALPQVLEAILVVRFELQGLLKVAAGKKVFAQARPTNPPSSVCLNARFSIYACGAVSNGFMVPVQSQVYQRTVAIKH